MRIILLSGFHDQCLDFYYVYFLKKELIQSVPNLKTAPDLATNFAFTRHWGFFQIKIWIKFEFTLEVYGWKSSSSGFFHSEFREFLFMLGTKGLDYLDQISIPKCSWIYWHWLTRQVGISISIFEPSLEFSKSTMKNQRKNFLTRIFFFFCPGY